VTEDPESPSKYGARKRALTSDRPALVERRLGINPAQSRSVMPQECFSVIKGEGRV